MLWNWMNLTRYWAICGKRQLVRLFQHMQESSSATKCSVTNKDSTWSKCSLIPLYVSTYLLNSSSLHTNLRTCTQTHTMTVWVDLYSCVWGCWFHLRSPKNPGNQYWVSPSWLSTHAIPSNTRWSCGRGAWWLTVQCAGWQSLNSTDFAHKDVTNYWHTEDHDVMNVHIESIKRW